jgi:hypothetical protein
VISCFALLYLIYFYVLAVLINEENLRDVIVSTKAFFYLLIIGLCVNNKAIFKLPHIIVVFHTLLFLYLVKYGYSRVFSLSDRPGIFTENNFELLFILILAVGIWQLRGYTLWKEVFALVIIVGLSGSRSGVLELLLILIVATRFSLGETNGLRSKGGVLLAIAILLPVLAIVATSRSTGDVDLESIDRYSFFLHFLEETDQWSAFDWLIGSPPLTELSGATCKALSFYGDLFSYSKNGSCYSVIFHSMIMRTVFDHGLFGLLFILYYVWLSLTVAKFDRKVKIAIIGSLLINGTSVSSFNSIYAELPMAMLLLTRR